MPPMVPTPKYPPPLFVDKPSAERDFLAPTNTGPLNAIPAVESETSVFDHADHDLGLSSTAWCIESIGRSRT
eukprot:5891810-Prorocentrum_lima.AAC.1